MHDHTTDDTTDGRRGGGVVRRLRDERGATLALVALGSAVLIGMAAISIDLGMLMTAKTQAQRAADSGAHAGAVVLAQTPGNEAGARTLAIASAADNAVMGDNVVVQPGDVTFPAEDEVKVTVHRIKARNNPIGTFFARILGFNAVNLSVDATAHVSTTQNIEFECLLPVTIQDRWWEDASGTLPDENDSYHDESDPDDGEADIYVPWGAEGFSESQYTGYSEADIGTEFVIKSNEAPGDYNPSWYKPWTGNDDTKGANWYRDRISGSECGNARSPGDDVVTEPGNMVGPTKQGFQALIDQDPGAQWNTAWNPDCNCDPIIGGMGMNSPRIRPIPMFDPTSGPANGRSDFTLSNFAGMFVQEIRGQEVIGRFMGVIGAKKGGGDEPSNVGPLFVTIEIIE